MNIAESVKLYKTYYCLDCGVCTGSCPVSRVLPAFSPRLIVEKALLEMGDELLKDGADFLSARSEEFRQVHLFC